MEQTLPSTCRVKFENPDALHDFYMTIYPDEGFWKGGRFVFHIVISEDYNMAVSNVDNLSRLQLKAKFRFPFFSSLPKSDV